RLAPEMPDRERRDRRDDRDGDAVCQQIVHGSSFAEPGHRPARACPVDDGTGARSQMRIEATLMVPRQTKSRLSNLVATAPSWRMARWTVLRCWQAAGSKTGGRPAWLPRWRRRAAWPAGSGMVALMPRRRRCTRVPALEYALSPSIRPGRVRGRPGPRRAILS